MAKRPTKSVWRSGKPAREKRILSASPGRAIAVRRATVRARYDAAQTTDDNRRHWANADYLSADAASSPGVRNIIRARCRYEVANNSIARGIIETLANDTIGTGPRLQVLLRSQDLVTAKDVNAELEREFKTWTAAIGLPEKLRVMRKGKVESGEDFAVLVLNPRLPTVVKRDISVIEADQCASPNPNIDNPVDGIELDVLQNPIAYHFLRDHPGSMSSLFGFGEFDRVPAEEVMHYFRVDRPGQHRGLPEIMSGLPLFAQLRRFTLAVIAAAETAADFAAVLQTETAGNVEDMSGREFETLELEQRLATVLPAGYKLGQIDAKQPATTYAEFKKEIINEMARCFNMPFNIAAGNSGSYNYASGRMDHQMYFKSIEVERDHIEHVILDRLFSAWLFEAVRRNGYLSPQALAALEASGNNPPHQWFWDGQEHVDPVKEAKAQETRLLNHTTTLAEECARDGRDWEETLQQRARELDIMRELGIPIPGAQPDPNMAEQPNEDTGDTNV